MANMGGQGGFSGGNPSNSTFLGDQYGGGAPFDTSPGTNVGTANNPATVAPAQADLANQQDPAPGGTQSDAGQQQDQMPPWVQDVSDILFGSGGMGRAQSAQGLPPPGPQGFTPGGPGWVTAQGGNTVGGQPAPALGPVASTGTTGSWGDAVDTTVANQPAATAGAAIPPGAPTDAAATPDATVSPQSGSGSGNNAPQTSAQRREKARNTIQSFLPKSAATGGTAPGAPDVSGDQAGAQDGAGGAAPGFGEGGGGGYPALNSALGDLLQGNFGNMLRDLLGQQGGQPGGGGESAARPGSDVYAQGPRPPGDIPGGTDVAGQQPGGPQVASAGPGPVGLPGVYPTPTGMAPGTPGMPGTPSTQVAQNAPGAPGTQPGAPGNRPAAEAGAAQPGGPPPFGRTPREQSAYQRWWDQATPDERKAAVKFITAPTPAQALQNPQTQQPNPVATRNMPGGVTSAAIPPATQGFGELPNQQNRPKRYGGQITINGKQFGYATGGGTFPSLPYGRYYIHPGAIGPVGRQIGAIAGVSDSNNPGSNTVKDTRLGRNRDGIEIHSADGRTNGCIGVNSTQWRAFSQEFRNLAGRGPMMLEIKPDGSATITTIGGAAPGNVAQARAAVGAGRV